jgi:ppGpp synthetase/RelA/SpoT-type nucleotidyltranferase
MAEVQLLSVDEAMLDDLVAHYVADLDGFERLLSALRAQVIDHADLQRLTHSARWRVKEPDHLRQKLARKLREEKAAGKAFTITRQNLFEKINDLAGMRLLHLHSTQFPEINAKLLALLDENFYSVIEGPVARIWDDEYEAYYQSIGVNTTKNPRMYTSVHYVVQPNTKTKRTVEIQVRTLAEELWGEVDHAINYPIESPRRACREQIKVLARLTSSCSRLVDSIFFTHREGN